MKGVANNMKIQESAENYLETILILSREKGNVRAIDIANEMNFSKPTVSIAMKNFRASGLIVTNDAGYIQLSEDGKKIAEQIYERHTVIADVLMALGVSKETAYADSCKIEHDISEESFVRIKEYYNKHMKK